jgi:hypothetical protein
MKELISKLATHRTTLLVAAICSFVWSGIYRFWLVDVPNEVFPIAAPRIGLFMDDLALAYLTSYMFFVMVEYWGKGQERKRIIAFKDYLSKMIQENYKRYTFLLLEPENIVPMIR